MKIWNKPPRVALIAQTRVNWDVMLDMLQERGLEWSHEGHLRCVVAGSDAALLAEYAGRGCYNSFDGPSGAGMGRKTNADYMGHIIETGHGSVLEHATFTFACWGVSRGFTHETVRHRAGTAFSQASTRFRDESKMGTVVVPPLFRDDPEACEAIAQAADASMATYNALRRIGRRTLKDTGLTRTGKIKTVRGAARAALPIGLESPITVTMNVRMVRNFLDQRASQYAELEIREVAMIIYDLMMEECPVLFADYEVLQMADGTTALHKGLRKV